ncbi:hypothetical protein NAEGRDRAFT_56635 [Naegleria gruberi]|uniref:Uncharacterized protein n=1 Tax=Naegleria gruberi TaxID=5762 RepID=D2UZL2_NAEGR|nr:uncharacterized protein NAEGRDRAFT_56635 [Naegleria gruberi]EFC49962.1 hypothetical protein NAEGRDRAFT_56635 [Naegleria gruberi]|eukprot:XP_002682706.1 hypothetical protein NAEGRDRAFT_56635 [Naegleria gruberi strain NEG-M]
MMNSVTTSIFPNNKKFKQNNNNNNTESIRNLILKHARLGQVKQVLELLSRITLPKNSPNDKIKEIELEKENIIHTLMLAYAKKGSLHKTEILFRKLQNPTLKCYTILLGVYAEKGLIDKVKQLFSKIEKPDQACYVVLMNTYSKLGMFDKIQNIYSNIYYKLLNSKSLEGNNETKSGNELLVDLTQVIKSNYKEECKEFKYYKDIFIVVSGFKMYYHLKKKEYLLVEDTFAKAREFINNDNINILNVYLQSLIHRNTSIEQIEHFIKNSIRNPDHVTYHLLMVYYHKLKNYDKVEKLYKAVTQLDDIDTQKRNYFDAMIMTMFYEREMFDKVEKIFRQIKSPDYKCYLILMRCYLKQMDSDKMIQLFKEMPNELVNDNLVTEMMQMTLHANRK